MRATNKTKWRRCKLAFRQHAEILKILEDAVPENTKKAKIVLLRSLSEYIRKQLFFEIDVNSG